MKMVGARGRSVGVSNGEVKGTLYLWPPVVPSVSCIEFVVMGPMLRNAVIGCEVLTQKFWALYSINKDLPNGTDVPRGTAFNSAGDPASAGHHLRVAN